MVTIPAMASGAACSRNHGSQPARGGFRLRLILPVLAGLLLLGGCAGDAARAPTLSREDGPRWKPAQHQVKAGETLYSIAWQHGLDYKVLARWNRIRPPYVITIGQRIRLQPSREARPPAQLRPATSPRAPRLENKKSLKSNTKKKQRAAVKKSSRIVWHWPARGHILSRFSARDPRRRGLDIAGKQGQAVRAAAAGRVVYAGSGLRGFGVLIIVKHDNNYLSAYAHNRKLLVSEGVDVQAGQRIAEMGDSGTDRVKLHFEIRRDGKPVDPQRYLPKRAGG